MRRRGRGLYVCARTGCDNELNEVTVKNQDPFCSSPCAREWHGTQLPPPQRGVTVGSSS